MELYIHIPFCVRKCNYCDFLSFPAGSESIESYCRALDEEICRMAEIIYEKQEDRNTGRISTIFVGGGTPSVLAPSRYAVCFSVCGRIFLSARTRRYPWRPIQVH